MLKALTHRDKSLLLQTLGTHKKDRKLLPALAAKLLKEALAQQTIVEIAEDLELTETSTLRRIISLLRLPSELQPLIVWGRQPGYLSFSVAAEVARLTGPKDIQKLAAIALEQNFSKEEARAVVQRLSRAGLTIEEAVSDILLLRPKKELQHLFFGVIPECWKSRGDADEATRAVLRRKLAQAIDPAGILSVSCRDGR
jgi:hypothetical protein